MKKLKIGILSIAIMATVGLAFARSPKAHFLNTYIAVQKPGGFAWIEITDSNPISNYSCVAGIIECTEYMANTPPPDNTYPSGFTNEGFIFISNN